MRSVSAVAEPSTCSAVFSASTGAMIFGVPALIEAGKWDSVRAILIQPPIADVWGKNAKPLLKRYAEAVGNADGDELAVLEARRAASRRAA